MIRENQKYFNILQVLLDGVSVYLAFLLAYFLRFRVFSGHSIFPLSYYLKLITCLLPVYLILYSWMNLYTSRRTRSFTQEVSTLCTSNILAILVLTLYLFTGKDRTQDFSRWLIVLFGITNTSLTILYHGFIRLFLRYYRQRGYNLKHCLIIGTSSVAVELIHKIKTHPAWGYHIIGCLSSQKEPSPAFAGYRILGHLDDLETVLLDYKVDIAMIATDEKDASYLGKIINSCEKAGIKTHIIPYYHRYIPATPYMDDLDGLPIIDTRHVPLDNFFKAFLKRGFDICFSILALIFFSPLLLFSVLMIKLTSPGPILYVQERIGHHQNPFKMYKFRSMRVQTHGEEYTQWTTKNDPRKTSWGNVMRKLSIDELPQFFNVLKGDMSVIGPRPERPYFVEQFKEEIPHYMIKHQVRPGITGWAQVNGLRGDTSIKDRIDYDLYYIENWSLALDFKIIFLTLLRGFINKNAY